MEKRQPPILLPFPTISTTDDVSKVADNEPENRREMPT